MTETSKGEDGILVDESDANARILANAQPGVHVDRYAAENFANEVP